MGQQLSDVQSGHKGAGQLEGLLQLGSTCVWCVVWCVYVSMCGMWVHVWSACGY